MKIAVTGTTGHLGRLTIEALLQGDTEVSDVIALARDTERASQSLRADMEIRYADYDSSETLDAALTGVDTLVLISSNAVGQRSRQHRNVIDAAQRAAVSRIVYTSVLGAREARFSPVAGEHVVTEDLLHASGIPTTILRNGWYTENFVDSARQAMETGELLGNTHGGKIASASRADYAQAAAVVAATDGHEGQTYELSGDWAWTYADLAVILTELSGRDVHSRDVSEEFHLDALVALAGMDEALAGFVVAVDQAIAAGELAKQTGELSVLIGHPTTDVTQTLAEALSR
ncbi:NAD(P)H dehydrogenase (quinone) [Micrococcales bacterium KH10]|nr:NAD(P)H dehydrogenase (quinone) [Micrococcales bacterium KH10]